MTDAITLVKNLIEGTIIGNTYLFYIAVIILIFGMLLIKRVPLFLASFIVLPLIIVLLPNTAIIFGGLLGGIFLFYILKTIFFGW